MKNKFLLFILFFIVGCGTTKEVEVVKQYHFNVKNVSSMFFISQYDDSTLKVENNYISFMQPIYYESDTSQGYYFEDIRGREIYIDTLSLFIKQVNHQEINILRNEIQNYYKGK